MNMSKQNKNTNTKQTIKKPLEIDVITYRLICHITKYLKLGLGRRKNEQ
jgi:hypothetical protein